VNPNWEGGKKEQQVEGLLRGSRHTLSQDYDIVNISYSLVIRNGGVFLGAACDSNGGRNWAYSSR
jgi:hypothetical protein